MEDTYFGDERLIDKATLGPITRHQYLLPSLFQAMISPRTNEFATGAAVRIRRSVQRKCRGWVGHRRSWGLGFLDQLLVPLVFSLPKCRRWFLLDHFGTVLVLPCLFDAAREDKVRHGSPVGVLNLPKRKIRRCITSGVLKWSNRSRRW